MQLAQPVQWTEIKQLNNALTVVKYTESHVEFPLDLSHSTHCFSEHMYINTSSTNRLNGTFIVPYASLNVLLFLIINTGDILIALSRSL